MAKVKVQNTPNDTKVVEKKEIARAEKALGSTVRGLLKHWAATLCGPTFSVRFFL